jgi:hypothetical protein
MAPLSPYNHRTAAGHSPERLWGAAGLRLCYVPVQSGISKEDALWEERVGQPSNLNGERPPADVNEGILPCPTTFVPTKSS